MKKSLYVNCIVKDSKNNIEKYLFSENERLNAIIDELEDKIDKAIEYIKEELAFIEQETLFKTIIYQEELYKLLEILGDKE